MITSKLTSKAQTTIPQAVRNALHLRGGDEIAYAIEGEAVTLRRVETMATVQIEERFGTFSEWDSEADRKAYSDL
ncbi:MAG: AbrB/MazE/SpoVT family DNA-binding domain-containing protein [Bosea sp. (in: a-proteobacteria)]|uniref:AbrB/MazE/SpoVT family DNA-binding domain-containing protein n=1 Tax=Bosea sp. (in: a-proteobacteria) TaxID=1871050 RepID=UPI003F7CC975